MNGPAKGNLVRHSSRRTPLPSSRERDNPWRSRLHATSIFVELNRGQSRSIETLLPRNLLVSLDVIATQDVDTLPDEIVELVDLLLVVVRQYVWLSPFSIEESGFHLSHATWYGHESAYQAS